jgi:hypothetical protein
MVDSVGWGGGLFDTFLGTILIRTNQSGRSREPFPIALFLGQTRKDPIGRSRYDPILYRYRGEYQKGVVGIVA